MLPALATFDDLATALGSDPEDTAQAQWLLSRASTDVRAYTGKSYVDDETGELVDDVPDGVVHVVVSMVVRAMLNPTGAVTTSDVAGPFQHTTSFGPSAADRLYMTAGDRLTLDSLRTVGLRTMSLSRGVVEMPGPPTDCYGRDPV